MFLSDLTFTALKKKLKKKEVVSVVAFPLLGIFYFAFSINATSVHLRSGTHMIL